MTVRIDIHTSCLVSASARGGSVRKDLDRAVGKLLDLVVGVAVIHIKLYTIEGPTHATASAGYVTVFIYFLDEFLQ